MAGKRCTAPVAKSKSSVEIISVLWSPRASLLCSFLALTSHAAPLIQHSSVKSRQIEQYHDTKQQERSSFYPHRQIFLLNSLFWNGVAITKDPPINPFPRAAFLTWRPEMRQYVGQELLMKRSEDGESAIPLRNFPDSSWLLHSTYRTQCKSPYHIFSFFLSHSQALLYFQAFSADFFFFSGLLHRFCFCSSFQRSFFWCHWERHLPTSVI